MSLVASRLRAALAPWVLALLGVAPMGCATEVSLCQVDGMKLETPDGMLQVWVNPILYVRNFGDGLFESSTVVVTVLNGSEVIVPPTRFPNFTSDPGGTYVCPRTASAMGSTMTGIALPRTFPRNARFSLSVKVDITDTGGVSRSLTAPVGQLRYAVDGMPSFSCSSTRCGR